MLFLCCLATECASDLRNTCVCAAFDHLETPQRHNIHLLVESGLSHVHIAEDPNDLHLVAFEELLAANLAVTVLEHDGLLVLGLEGFAGDDRRDVRNVLVVGEGSGGGVEVVFDKEELVV